MKIKLLFAASAAFALTLQSCDNTSKEETDASPGSSDGTFKAVEMPTILANGDPFPTAESTINSWIAEPTVGSDGLETSPQVIGHAWGLWQALTETTDQEYNGRKLRRFETWYTPQDVMKAGETGKSLHEVQREANTLQFRPKFKFGHQTELSTQGGDLAGSVKYSPGMAQKALDGKYFEKGTIAGMVKPGEITTVAFNTNDVSLKPIYRVLTDMNKVKGKDDTYYFHIWSGPEIDGGKPLKKFKRTVEVCTKEGSPTIDDKNVYGLNSFIWYKMTADEAYTYNKSAKEGQEFTGDVAKEGDVVILLGMHVSTRETSRWTWQSFYWTETPDNPLFPSSSTMADGRKNLKTALEKPADHYAVTIGYSMMSPALPVDGGPVDIATANVQSVYALNPYIEGTFTDSTFINQQAYFKDYGNDGDYTKQFRDSNVDGVTSNCMSCHSQAAYNGNAMPNFIADQYINRNAPWFKGYVQLDFAWSLYPGFEPRPSKVDKPDK